MSTKIVNMYLTSDGRSFELELESGKSVRMKANAITDIRPAPKPKPKPKPKPVYTRTGSDNSKPKERK